MNDLKDVLEFLAEVEPERCERLERDTYALHVEGMTHFIERRRGMAHELSLTEYALRGVVEARGWAWTILSESEGVQPMASVETEERQFDAFAATPVLALARAYREALGQ